MSATATLEELLKRNEAVVAHHTPIPTLAELGAAGAPVPKTMIVTCMDPRCIPEKYFDLQVGETVVVRNGGGNVRHALRDITIIDQLFGLEELVIIHHTDCGTLQWTEEKMRAKVKASFPEKHWAEIDATVYGSNADIVESVRDDVEWVRAHPLIQDKVKKGCRGFVYDIKTGRLDKVDV